MTVTGAMCDPIFVSTVLRCECGEDCEVVGDVTNASCGNLGAINVELICGDNNIPIETYKWEDGSESENRENLTPGEYCVTIVDEECGEVGCEDDGSLTVSINTDEAYSLIWTGPNGFSSNQETIANLERGIYSLEVSFEDPAFCDILEIYTIALCDRTVYNSHFQECENLSDYGEYEAIVSLDGPPIPVSNDNLCGGALNIDINAPYNSYFFHWEGPNGYSSIEEDIAGLCEGEYCLILDNGCYDQEDCFDIVNCDKSEIRIDGEVINTCPDVAFGSINILVEGGSEPYIYEWSSGQTVEDLEDIAAGTYMITVFDKNGCAETAEFFVTDDILIVEEPRPSDMCIQYFSCSGEIVNELTDNIGIAGCEYLEEDCRFEVCTCNDGVRLEPINKGLRPLQRDIFNECRLVRYCFNDEEYLPARVQGTFLERTEEKLNDIDETPGADKTVWFCCNVSGCVFPPEYREWNATIDRHDGLIISIAGDPGGGVGCTIQGSCNGITFYDKHFPGETCTEEIEPVRGDCNLVEISPNNIEDPNGEVELAEISYDESIFQLELGEHKETIISNVYPNPFSKELNIDISSREKQIINYSIVNMGGRTLLKNKVQVEKNTYSYNINLSKISQSGLLFLVLLDEHGNRFHYKIIKL